MIDNTEAQNKVKQILAHLHRNRQHPVTVPQSIYEFYTVATRPRSSNGLGMTPHDAGIEVMRLTTLFPLQLDTSSLYFKWYDLVTTYNVSGKPAHDARLVAAMLVNGIPHILTYNSADFLRYQNKITVMDANTL